MAESTVTSKGQITIPKEIRDLLNLEEKDKVVFVPEKNWVIMAPLKGNILSLFGSVKHKGRRPLNFSKIREQIKGDIARKAKA